MVQSWANLGLADSWTVTQRRCYKRQGKPIPADLLSLMMITETTAWLAIAHWIGALNLWQLVSSCQSRVTSGITFLPYLLLGWAGVLLCSLCVLR